MMSSTENIVELIEVEKKYLGVNALQSLSLNLQAGEVFGLFGHNGAGKTTIIKLILGLIEATSGSVSVFGKDPTQSGARELRGKLGFLQENVSFYDQLTGQEVLEYFARLKGFARKSCRKECLELLAQVGLKDASGRRVKTYSKGMRQRLGLAQALLGSPRLLLLDEPTVGLDPIATQDFYHSIDHLKHQGCTVVLCSHVLPGVEKYIDRALILGQGEVLASGSIEQLRSQANLPAVFQLQGQSEVLPEDLRLLARCDSSGMRMAVPMQEKMQTLRTLASLSGVENIDVQLPSLEDLYTHFIQRHCDEEAAL
ncbi:ABC transporter ATP-binding protein [Aliamphritea ceti]|uniref:ABC transporter ATP-binding protein n=1 Tax=Aliamphritea ceti TaxID=1524258 RepID=UPI0021C2FD10|nr:ABC transporter ATP-binding protein [Aliamphritea ceti]